LEIKGMEIINFKMSDERVNAVVKKTIEAMEIAEIEKA